MTKYREITDSSLQSRVCTRYSTNIAALEALGFRRLAFKLEARGPFSALLYLPLLPLMRRAKEVLVFPFPLRLAVANVLLVHSEPSSIASCMGLGVKFYTNFSDHSLDLVDSSEPRGPSGPRRAESKIADSENSTLQDRGRGLAVA